MKKIRLIWDFHGEDSKGTAAHHIKHLEQFMEREALELIRTAVYSAADQHHMACLTVHEKDVLIIRDALKPHRAVVVE
ncbi:MAG: hypothetical protein WDZ35_07280 [Crocinitomicaceae bacterium]